MNQTRIVNPGPGAAPNAPTPGRGAGNVPFAPGIMSGKNLGQQTNPTPLARNAGPPPPPQRGTVPPSAPPGPQMAPGGQPPMGGPMGGMMGPQNPWPQIYFQLLDVYLKALVDSTSKPMFGVMY